MIDCAITIVTISNEELLLKDHFDLSKMSNVVHHFCYFWYFVNATILNSISYRLPVNFFIYVQNNKKNSGAVVHILWVICNLNFKAYSEVKWILKLLNIYASRQHLNCLWHVGIEMDKKSNTISFICKFWNWIITWRKIYFSVSHCRYLHA